jgi:hypothetical protein
MADSNKPIISTTDLGDGWNRKCVENWRRDRHGDESVLTYYTNPETKRLTAEFYPEAIVIGEAIEDEAIEAVVHPFASVSKTLNEFPSVDIANHKKLVEYSNWHLERFYERILNEDSPLVVKRHGLKTNSEEQGFQRAMQNSYIIKLQSPDGKIIYIPSREAIRAICDTKFETFMYGLALHTGVSMGTGHRRVNPDYAD